MGARVTFEIDTDAALRIAAAWSDLADVFARHQFDLERLLDDLMTDSEAPPRLADGSNALMWLATVVFRVVDAVLAGDAYDIGPLPAQHELVYTPGHGDLDGTYHERFVADYPPVTGDLTGIGRARLSQALRDTANRVRMRADEFCIVELAPGRVMVVLGGVTDLSDLDFGLSKQNRTVRDFDRVALGSWGDASVDGNRYASLVWDALICAGVHKGSELIVVGHSFGADTALDLARDRTFNGEGGFKVTHVLAAAYALHDELDGIPQDTSILVINSRNDRVVDGEEAAHQVVMSMGGEGAALGAALHEFTKDGPPPTHVTKLFDGGHLGKGHHPENYARFLENTGDPDVIAFLASVGGAAAVGGRARSRRRAGAAPASAIDVSEPQKS